LNEKSRGHSSTLLAQAAIVSGKILVPVAFFQSKKKKPPGRSALPGGDVERIEISR
jgi:hypothetical protein